MVSRTRRTPAKFHSNDKINVEGKNQDLEGKKPEEQSVESTTAIQSPSSCTVLQRRRSRRLASQESESNVACSFAGAALREQEKGVEVVPAGPEENAFLEEKSKEMDVKEKNVQNNNSNAGVQSSPIALRTRSRCSSVESNGAGNLADAQVGLNTVTPTRKKKLTSASTPRRKRASLMPKLKEIVEEERKNDDTEDNEKLLQCNLEEKVMPKQSSEFVESLEMDAKVQNVTESNRSNIDKCMSVEEVNEGGERSDSSTKLVEHSLCFLKSPDMSPKISAKSSEKSPTISSGKLSRSDEISGGKSPVIAEKGTILQEASESLLENSNKPLQQSERDSQKMSEKLPDTLPVEIVTNSINDLEQETEQIVRGKARSPDSSGESAWPVLNDLHSLWSRRGDQKFLVENIEKSYVFVNKVDSAVPTISEELVSTDTETIWQQIAYGNKKFHRFYAKWKQLLDIELSSVDKKTTESDSSKCDFPDESYDNSDSYDSEEVDVDLFNLKEDQIEKLNEDLESEESEDSVDDRDDKLNNEDEGYSKETSNRRWKSAVDDRFFSLAEMEEFLDRQEKEGVDMNENFFEQFDKHDDDLTDFETEYRYADFYGSLSDGEEEKEDQPGALKKSETSKKVSHSDGEGKSRKKKVKFIGVADDSSSNDDDVNGRNTGGDNTDDVQERTKSDDVNEDRPVLLGPVDDERENETEFQLRQKKLQERISTIEKANLAPRSWDLSGEVTAMEREENTMLEKNLYFDQSTRCAPVITADVTAEIEAMIIQRIKDQAFDDVVRVERKPETSKPFREPIAEEEVVKKSLAEVYEDQYQKKQYGSFNEEKINEKHEEIKKLMSALFQKLNALTHFRYVPPEVQQEVRIVNNMPSLQKEEVGPMASTDAVLLAPEEIHKHASGLIKGDDEKTKTDRSRARRKKKKWQHEMHLKKQQAESTAKQDDVRVKKQGFISRYDNKGNSKKLTPVSFFQRLQATTTEEVQSKKRKIDERDAKRKRLSTSYKL